LQNARENLVAPVKKRKISVKKMKCNQSWENVLTGGQGRARYSIAESPRMLKEGSREKRSVRWEEALTLRKVVGMRPCRPLELSATGKGLSGISGI